MNNDKGKYPITVSDWLGILQDKNSINFNLLIFTGLVVITTIIAIPTIYSYYNLENRDLTILIGILFIYFIFVGASKKLENKSIPYKKLYDKIIQGEITEPTEILKEYNLIELRKKEHLNKKRWGKRKMKKIHLSRLIMYIGFIVIILGVLIIVKDIGINNNNPRDSIIYGSIPISLGLGVFALGISLSADEKMKTISDESFLALIGIFEDYRLSLKTKRTVLKHLKDSGKENTTDYEILYTEYFDTLSYSIWKSFTYLRRAKVLLRGVISEEYEEGLIHYTTEYFAELIIGKDFTNMLIIGDYKDHLRKIYDFVSSLKRYNTHKDKTKMEEYKIRLNF